MPDGRTFVFGVISMPIDVDDATAEIDFAVTSMMPDPSAAGKCYAELLHDDGVPWYDAESERMLAEFRATMNVVLNGATEREQEMRNDARALALRSRSLCDLVGGEMLQFERLRKYAAKPNQS